MTLNLSAIFGTDTSDTIIVVPVMASTAPAADPIRALDPAVAPSIINPVPIVPGTEHFSLWINDAEGPWPEFIPGYHYNIRQPSRFRGLCSPRNRNESDRQLPNPVNVNDGTMTGSQSISQVGDE